MNDYVMRRGSYAPQRVKLNAFNIVKLGEQNVDIEASLLKTGYGSSAGG